MRDIQLVKIEQKGTQRYYSLSLNQSVEQLKRLIEIVESECIL
jgi:arginine repressor